MYRAIAIFIISIFCISASDIDSRVERWNLRIEKLKKLQADADAGKMDRDLIHELAANGIKSSEDFLELLARYKKEDGSLKSETKKYTVSDIEKKVNETTLPSISIFYLSELFRSANDAAIKQQISDKINALVLKKYGPGVKIIPSESMGIAAEYIFERGISEFDSFQASIKQTILSKTEYELSRRDYNSNEIDIIRLIVKHAEDSVSAGKFPDIIIFDEKILSTVPGWKFLEIKCSKNEERKKSVMNFIQSRKGKLSGTNSDRDIFSAANEIFEEEKEKISGMLQNTITTSGSTGNNPHYIIPDIRKLASAIDEIDKYRKSLINNITGSEDIELIKKMVSNNTGIAARNISRIENIFKNEEARIERLKKLKSDIIVYNEEVFNSSKKLFHQAADELYKYAALSGDFIDVLYSSGKTDPAEFIELHRYRCGRYMKYISFAEKLTADTSALPEYGTAKLQSLYKGTIPKVLHSIKIFLRPESIPAGIRETMNRDKVKEFASINSGLRTNGTLLASAIRKNYDATCAGFARVSLLKKDAFTDSEGKIGQDEVDRLYSFAAKCSGVISSLKYTETSLKKYLAEFNRITEEINKGSNNPGTKGIETLFSRINGFNPEEIDRETITREILAREGMEALSGAISLVHYYKRKGVLIKLIPADEEISSMKRIFMETPEVAVSSWRMNGRNFRKIDANIIAELKKIQGKNAWLKPSDNSAKESFVIKKTGMSISFTPPTGWKKLSSVQNPGDNIIKYESPDLKGSIVITALTVADSNIQILANSWPEKSGFSMIKKTPGKKHGMDYMQSTAKNRYDQVMESYIIGNKGHVIIISGKTTGDLYRQLNRTLSELFRNMVISGS